MRGLVVLALDPRPQAAVQALQGLPPGIFDAAQPAGPERAEEPFDLALPRRLERPGVDQRHAQPGADQGDMARAVGASVVDIEALRQAAPDQRVPEHRQEGRAVLGHGEGREGDDAGGVVDEGDQVGLAPGPADADPGPVHDVAHPQLARLAVGEAAPVGAVVRRLPVEQPLAGEKPVHGGRGERILDAFLARHPDDRPHRTGRVPGLQRDQAFGDLGRQAPGLPAVGARLRIQRVEAAAAVQLDPAPAWCWPRPGSGRSREWCRSAPPWRASAPRCPARPPADAPDRRSRRSGTTRSPGEGRRASCSCRGPRSWGSAAPGP